MKKQSLVIIGANLAIVALLAVTAGVLVNKGKDPAPQSDVRSQASTKNSNTTVKPTTDKLETGLDENEKDIEAIIESPESVTDEEFPAFNASEFE